VIRLQHACVLCAIALTFIVLGTSHSTAGIVLDSNGNVTSFTYNSSTYYFYKGSFNDNAAIIDDLYSTESGNLNQYLKNDLLAAPSATPNAYLFAAAPSTSTVNVRVTYYNGSTWGHLNNTFDRSLTTVDGLDIYYASTTAPSGGDVPEPSTAIAMGLLGMIGFAGRRRLRQVSAA